MNQILKIAWIIFLLLVFSEGTEANDIIEIDHPRKDLKIYDDDDDVTDDILISTGDETIQKDEPILYTLKADIQ
jgi:hypothetical protein